MPQVLAVADFEVEFKKYKSGAVISFSDDSVVSHLRSRRVISTSATDVAAAISGGAVPVWHAKGDPQSAGGVASGSASLYGALAAQAWPFITPKLMGAPPSVSTAQNLGANALPATALATSKSVKPWEAGAFTYLGAPVKRMNGNALMIMGAWPTSGAQGITIADCIVTTADPTGRFEIDYHAVSTVAGVDGVRVVQLLENDSWGYLSQAATFTTSGTGSFADAYKGVVTMGAPGTYRFRLEFSYGFAFRGVTVDALGSVKAGPPLPTRWFASSDSYGGNTVIDKGPSFGSGDAFGAQLIYLTGMDIAMCGVGAADYATDSPTQPVTNPCVAKHLAADLAAWGKGQGVVFFNGLNDIGGSATTADVSSAVQACQNIVKAYDRNLKIHSCSSFWQAGLLQVSKSRALAMNDAIKAVTLANGGKYFDVMSADPPPYLGVWRETQQAALNAGATTLTLATMPTVIAANTGAGASRDGWHFRIGSGDNSEIRRVTSCSTAGVLTFDALTFAHDAGEPITLAGPSYVHGVGYQASATITTATGATLPDTQIAGTYFATFPSGAQRQITIANGSAGQAVTWTGNISDTGTVTVSLCSLSDGNAGLVVGVDRSHPTRRGHSDLANIVAANWLRAMLS